MKVLVLCADRGVPAHGPSGSSAHLRGIVAALADAGHDVRLAVCRRADHRGEHGVVDAPIVPCERRRWGWLPRRWRDRGEVWDGRRLVRAALADGWRPDLVWERHSGLCDAGPTVGVPHVLEVNAPISIERTDLRDVAWASAKEAQVLRGATRIVAVSRWLADWARSLGCADVRHVPNGTDLPTGDRARGRAALGLEGPVVGFVGSMKPWHGVERLPAILDALPQASGILVGDGPVEVTHPRLRRIGRLEGQAFADAVAAFDVGLAPYPADAPPWFCPLKVLDYRAQGVPVVGSDIGDTRALVGAHGVVLPAGASAEVWAEAVRRASLGVRAPSPRPWSVVVGEALAGLEAGRPRIA